jgi:hypothetical protein
MDVDWWSPCVAKDLSEIWAALSSTRNVPTGLIHSTSSLCTNAETTNTERRGR